MEGIALFSKLSIQALSIDNVPIVGDGQTVGALANDYWLSIGYSAGAFGGIAIVTNSNMPAKLTQGILIKCLRYQPHSGIYLELVTISGGDTGTFLAAMLKSK